jgi:hypothetical protein
VATVPLPHQFAVGEVATANNVNTYYSGILFLENPPLLTMIQGVAVTSIPNSAWTSLGFDTNTIDTYNGHSTITNNSRYVAQVAGWYRTCGNVSFVANTTGIRGVRLAVNGTVTNASANYTNPTLVGAVTTMTTPTKNVFLNVNDFIEVQAIQTSGGALNTNIGTDGNNSSLDLKFDHA